MWWATWSPANHSWTGDVVFGIRAREVVEDRLAAHCCVLGEWTDVVTPQLV